MFVLLAKEVVYSYEDCLPFLEKGSRVFLIDYSGWEYAVARELTVDNYDAIVAEAYAEHRSGYLEIYCDVLLFENGSIVSVPKGEYEVGIVGEVE